MEHSGGGQDQQPTEPGITYQTVSEDQLKKDIEYYWSSNRMIVE